MGEQVKQRKWKSFQKAILGTTMIAGITFLAINVYIVGSSKGYVFQDLAILPPYDVGLLMGTDLIRPDGSTNVHFLNRSEAAAKLYSAGKIKHLFISGNKNNKGFNEAEGLERVLLGKNVPQAAITLDVEGYRTFESAKRASQVYHLQRIVIITDEFHAARSLFLCKHFGIEAVAYSPGTEPLDFWFVRSRLREYFARVMSVFDVVYGWIIDHSA